MSASKIMYVLVLCTQTYLISLTAHVTFSYLNITVSINFSFNFCNAFADNDYKRNTTSSLLTRAFVDAYISRELFCFNALYFGYSRIVATASTAYMERTHKRQRLSKDHQKEDHYDELAQIQDAQIEGDSLASPPTVWTALDHLL